jgi:hypothetical protein
LDKIDAVIIVLFGGFFLEDDARDVLVESGGSEEHVSVSSSVLGSVLEPDPLKFFLDRSRRFVCSQDTFPWGADFVSGLDKFLRVVFGFHGTI